MPLPPLLIWSSTLASFTGLPLCSVLRLNKPLRDGPIFFSSVSTLWHIAHCSNVSLPLAASPFDADWAAEIPADREAQTSIALREVKVRRFIVQSPGKKFDLCRSIVYSLQLATTADARMIRKS